jgi:hypothetical protein
MMRTPKRSRASLVRAQVADALLQPHGHVHRVTSGEVGTAQVGPAMIPDLRCRKASIRQQSAWALD